MNTVPDPTTMYHELHVAKNLRIQNRKHQERKRVQWEASVPSLQEQAGHVDPVAQVSCPAVSVSFLHQITSANSSLLLSTAFCQCHDSRWQLSAQELLLTGLHFTVAAVSWLHLSTSSPIMAVGARLSSVPGGALPPLPIPMISVQLPSRLMKEGLEQVLCGFLEFLLH